MSGDWRVDVLIALIGAIGLIVPGWLAYKGAKVGKEPKPAVEQHGTVAWEHQQTRNLITAEAGKTRDFLAREHDETRRQIREACDRMGQQHEETRRQIRECAVDVPWDMLAALAHLRRQED